MMAAKKSKRTRVTKKRDAIVYEPPTKPGGMWVASIPGVPGAYSQGNSRAEARAMLRDALKEIGKASLIDERR